MFALGRAQELCILLESYWDRMNIKVPIYFSLGLTEKVGKTVWHRLCCNNVALWLKKKIGKGNIIAGPVDFESCVLMSLYIILEIIVY